MDLRGTILPSPTAGPAYRSQNIMEAHKPARQTVTVLLVITFLQGCLLPPLLHLLPYSEQSLLPNPGSPLSLHAPSPWHLLQCVVGVGGKLFPGPSTPPCFLSASSGGLSSPTSPDLPPFGTTFSSGIWVFFTRSREHSVHIGVPVLHPDLSFLPASNSLRLKCIHLSVMLRPSRVPLYNMSIFIKCMLE